MPKSFDAQIKEFVKGQALNSDETKVEIWRQVTKEFELIPGYIPSRSTVERWVERHRKGIQKLKREPDFKWEFEPFSLGALYAENISVPPDVVTALFSDQLQTQFCSQSFTNRDAKWLVRLKAFYDANLRRNANGLSRYGFEGLEKLPLGTMIGGHQDAKPQGWNASILNGLIEIAKNYSQYESQFQVENGQEKKLETRLLDSMLIWKAAPGVGQFLAARTPITGHPFWKSANKPGALTKKNNNPASDLAESEQTMPMQLFPPSYRENNLGMKVDLSAVLQGWAKENENYLESIATKVFEVGYYNRSDTYSELDFEEKIIGKLFEPVFEFTRTPECIQKKLKYNDLPDVASLPSNSLSTNSVDADENLLLVMALDFLSDRAPGVFKDFPETLARINKLERRFYKKFDPVHNPYSHPVSTVSAVDMKYGLSELCLEFETEIEDWNPKSSIVQGSYEFPFVLGLQLEWLESSNRTSDSELYREAMTDWEAREDHWHYSQEQDHLLDEYRASLEARDDKDESRT